MLLIILCRSNVLIISSIDVRKIVTFLARLNHLCPRRLGGVRRGWVKRFRFSPSLRSHPQCASI